MREVIHFKALWSNVCCLTCLFSASAPMCPCRHDTILLCVLWATTRTSSIRRSICVCRKQQGKQFHKKTRTLNSDHWSKIDKSNNWHNLPTIPGKDKNLIYLKVKKKWKWQYIISPQKHKQTKQFSYFHFWVRLSYIQKENFTFQSVVFILGLSVKRPNCNSTSCSSCWRHVKNYGSPAVTQGHVPCCSETTNTVETGLNVISCNKF